MSNDTISSGPWPDPPATLTSPMTAMQAQKPNRPFTKKAKAAGDPVNTADLARVAIQPVET